MKYICQTLGIRLKTISLYNHGSLKIERHIRTISKMISKKLTDTGQMWICYLQTCAYAYNVFASSALNGLSLF